MHPDPRRLAPFCLALSLLILSAGCCCMRCPEGRRQDERIVITNQPTNWAAYLDGKAEFRVAAVRKGKATAEPRVADTAERGATAEKTPGGRARALTYRWLRNGYPLAESARIQGTTTETLRISQVALDDVALYSCRITGSPAVDSEAASLFVYDGNTINLVLPPVSGPLQPPPNPANPTTTCAGAATTYSAYLTFLAPDKTIWFTPAPGTRSCVLRDVTTGSSYTAFLRALCKTHLMGQCSTPPYTNTGSNVPVTPTWTLTHFLASEKYSFSIFVTSANPPPIGTRLTLSVDWRQ